MQIVFRKYMTNCMENSTIIYRAIPDYMKEEREEELFGENTRVCRYAGI